MVLIDIDKEDKQGNAYCFVIPGVRRVRPGDDITKDAISGWLLSSEPRRTLNDMG
jgi:hypothetical protein